MWYMVYAVYAGSRSVPPTPSHHLVPCGRGMMLLTPLGPSGPNDFLQSLVNAGAHAPEGRRSSETSPPALSFPRTRGFSSPAGEICLFGAIASRSGRKRRPADESHAGGRRCRKQIYEEEAKRSTGRRPAVSYRAPPPPAAVRSVRPLREHVAQRRVVLVFVRVVDADVSGSGSARESNAIVVGRVRTSAGCPASGICVPGRGRKDKRIRGSRGRARVGSSRSCA